MSLSKLFVFLFPGIHFLHGPIHFPDWFGCCWPPLLYPALHFLLEDFISSYYYSPHSCSPICNSAIKCSASSILWSFSFGFCVVITFLCAASRSSPSFISYILGPESLLLVHLQCICWITFQKFAIPKEMQKNFDKWTRKMFSSCHKLGTPAPQVHPSLEFEVLAPAGIVDLLPAKAKFPSASTANSDLQLPLQKFLSPSLHCPLSCMSHFHLRCLEKMFMNSCHRRLKHTTVSNTTAWE